MRKKKVDGQQFYITIKNGNKARTVMKIDIYKNKSRIDIDKYDRTIRINNVQKVIDTKQFKFDTFRYGQFMVVEKLNSNNRPLSIVTDVTFYIALDEETCDFNAIINMSPFYSIRFRQYLSYVLDVIKKFIINESFFKNFNIKKIIYNIYDLQPYASPRLVEYNNDILSDFVNAGFAISTTPTWHTIAELEVK